MTEAEWMGCTDPETMIRYLANVVWFPNRTSKRKKRLFAVACCQRIGTLDERSCRELEAAERFADLGISQEESQAASAAYYEAAQQRGCPWQLRAVLAARAAGWGGAAGAAVCAILAAAEDPSAAQREREAQCRLLRDIFANPFRPVTLDPAWLTPGVQALAHSIYDDRAFDRLPILADALEDAGCQDAAILSHCRQQGAVHVRGCWVVDLLTGRR